MSEYFLLRKKSGVHTLHTHSGPVICPERDAIPLQRIDPDPITGQPRQSITIQQWSCDSQCQKFVLEGDKDRGNVTTLCGCRERSYAGINIHDEKEENPEAKRLKINK